MLINYQSQIRLFLGIMQYLINIELNRELAVNWPFIDYWIKRLFTDIYSLLPVVESQGRWTGGADLADGGRLDWRWNGLRLVTILSSRCSLYSPTPMHTPYRSPEKGKLQNKNTPTVRTPLECLNHTLERYMGNHTMLSIRCYLRFFVTRTIFCIFIIREPQTGHLAV